MTIDYKIIMYMVIGLFGMVGVMRGWKREALTTFLLLLLMVLLTQPALGQQIVALANKLARLVIIAVKGGLDFERMARVASDVKPPITDENAYSFFTFLIIGMVIISYGLGRITFKQEVSGLNMLLGGVLGGFNGFLILSLLVRFLFGGRFRGGAFVAQTVPSQPRIEIQGVPSQVFPAGYGLPLAVVFSLMLGFILFSSIFKVQPPFVRKK